MGGDFENVTPVAHGDTAIVCLNQHFVLTIQGFMNTRGLLLSVDAGWISLYDSTVGGDSL